MNRRTLLRTGAMGSLSGIAAGRELGAALQKSTRGMPSPKIKDIQVIAICGWWS